MKRFSTSVLILVLFVSVYIFCIVAYTFISSLNGIHYLEGKTIPRYDAFSRVRRAIAQKNGTWKKHVPLNVCCDKDEYLNSRLECVKANDTMGLEEDDKTSVLSQIVVVGEDMAKNFINLDTVVLKYKSKQMYPIEEMTVITWPKGQIHTHYIDERNGFLLELSDDRKTVVSNYSSSSFCVDAMRGRENSRIYVALLCPCKEKVCVQKCCPKEFYFNTIINSCKNEKEDGIESFKPSFAKGVPYHLMYSVPNCSGPDRMIVSEDESMMNDILQDGHLMALSSERGVFDRKKYCFDIFSNGSNNSSYVNGFYCPSEVKTLAGKKVKQQKARQVGYSSSTQNLANFGLLIVVVYLLITVIKRMV